MVEEVVVVPVSSRSVGENYTIVARRTEHEVTLTCTCKSATKGFLCRHRLDILTAEKLSEDPSARAIRKMLDEGFGARLIGAIREAESRAAAHRKRARGLKQQLARFLNGR